jgi:hypothetical protein
MSRSLRTIWIVMTPLAAVGLCCVLLARKYTLKRNVVKAGEQRPGSAGTQSEQGSGEKMEDATDVNASQPQSNAVQSNPAVEDVENASKSS